MILIFQFRDLRKRLSKEALNIEERCYGVVYRVKLKLLNRLMVSKGLYDIIISRFVLSRGGDGGLLYNISYSYTLVYLIV